MEFENIVGVFDFNRDDDKKRFGNQDRIITLTCFREDTRIKIGFSYNLGPKEDNSISMVFGLEELVAKIASVAFDAEV